MTAKYPYDDWLNGETWALHHGVDFVSQPNTMVELIRHAAALRGLDVSVERGQASRALTIRAYTPPGPDHHDPATRIFDQEN